MERFITCNNSFSAAICRSKELVNLYDALCLIKAGQLACDDALRAAWIQSVSSFDFFVHELIAIESMHRVKSGIPTKYIQLPMEIAIISEETNRLSSIEAHIRSVNSYKAFVSPEKLAKALSSFVGNPWDKIYIEFSKISEDALSLDNLKTTLRAIWNRRNKIAHEADINPTLSGTELWPMYRHDVSFTIEFLGKLAACLPAVVSQRFPPTSDNPHEHACAD